MKTVHQRFSKRILKGMLAAFCALSLVPAAGSQPVQAEETTSYDAQQLPSVKSDFVYLVDADTGQVLWDQASEERMYPASMTKMMTTIIAIETLTDTSQKITITQEMLDGLVEAGASRAGYKVGDEPTVLDLLYGDMLPSGADCSRALAFTIAGSESAYVDLMNQKAQQLGMTGTHYANTTGLHDDNHYSTCRDTATLLTYCLKNDLFRTIFSTERYKTTAVATYPNGLDLESVVLKYINSSDSTMKYNYSIPGFFGGKSGFTYEAEYCLASAASFNGMNLLLITAHAYINRYYPVHIEDASVIYNWFNQHYSRQTVLLPGTVLQTISVRNSLLFQKLTVTADETVALDLPSDGNLHIENSLPETMNAEVRQGQTLGAVSIYAYDQLVYTHTYQAERTVSWSLLGTVLTFGSEHPAAFAALLGLTVVALLLLVSRGRRRKKKRRKYSR